MATPFKKTYKLPDFIICPLCCDVLEKPRVLPCGHMFCQTCLQNNFEKSNKPKPFSRAPEPTEILCPTCFSVTSLPENGIRQFQNTVSQDHPSVKMGMYTKIVKDKKVNGACGMGSECLAGSKGKSEVYCCQCKRAFCRLCQNKHTRKYAGHIFIKKPAIYTMSCNQHKKPIDTLCSVCEILYCAKCKESHDKTHEVTPLPDKIERCKDKINEMEGDLRTFMKEKYNLLFQLEKLQTTYKKRHMETEQEIRREADRHIKEITKRREILMKKNTSQYRYLDRLIEDQKTYIQYLLRKMDNFRKMTYSFSMKGHEPKLLANYENIRVHSFNINHERIQKKERLDEIQTFWKFKSSDSMFVGELEKDTEELPALTPAEQERTPTGWVSLDSHCPLEKPTELPAFRLCNKEMGTSVRPMGLGFLPDGDCLIIAEYNSRKLCLVDLERDPKAEQKTFVTYPNNNFFPRDVVVIDDENTVAVTDDFEKCVKVFAFQQKPRVVKPKTLQFVSPSGLAYSRRKKLFVVSDIGQQNILVFDMKGNVKAQIPDRKVEEKSPYRLNSPDFVTIDHQERILVSDSRMNRIKVFELDGRFKFQFGDEGPGQLESPMGICVDRLNNILVVDAGHHRVCEFNEDGNFIRDILTDSEHGIHWPWGLALSSSGIVVISEQTEDNIKPFQVYNYESDSDDDT